MAQLNGDIYDKTCFKKIFLREGKYSSFTLQPSFSASQPITASQPSEDLLQPSANAEQKSSSESVPAGETVLAGGVTPTNTVQSRLAAFQRNSSLPLPLANEPKHTAARSSLVTAPAVATILSASTVAQHTLLTAIRDNDTAAISNYIQHHTVLPLLTPIDDMVEPTIQQTPVEYAFATERTDCARAMLQHIRTALEANQMHSNAQQNTINVQADSSV